MCHSGECSGCSVLADLEIEMDRGTAAQVNAAAGASRRATAEEIAAASRREAAETIHALMTDVSTGVRVLRTRDGVALTDEQIRERAANIVCGLIGNYRIERLDGVRFARPAVAS